MSGLKPQVYYRGSFLVNLYEYGMKFWKGDYPKDTCTFNKVLLVALREGFYRWSPMNLFFLRPLTVITVALSLIWGWFVSQRAEDNIFFFVGLYFAIGSVIASWMEYKENDKDMKLLFPFMIFLTIVVLPFSFLFLLIAIGKKLGDFWHKLWMWLPIPNALRKIKYKFIFDGVWITLTSLFLIIIIGIFIYVILHDWTVLITLLVSIAICVLIFVAAGAASVWNDAQKERARAKAQVSRGGIKQERIPFKDTQTGKGLYALWLALKGKVCKPFVIADPS